MLSRHSSMGWWHACCILCCYRLWFFAGAHSGRVWPMLFLVPTVLLWCGDSWLLVVLPWPQASRECQVWSTAQGSCWLH